MAETIDWQSLGYASKEFWIDLTYSLKNEADKLSVDNLDSSRILDEQTLRLWEARNTVPMH